MDKPPCLMDAWNQIALADGNGVLDGAYSVDNHNVTFSVCCFEQGRYFGGCDFRSSQNGWVARSASVDNGVNRLAPCQAFTEKVFDTWAEAACALYTYMSRPLDMAVEIINRMQEQES